jgi:hypothetical protein
MTGERALLPALSGAWNTAGQTAAALRGSHPRSDLVVPTCLTCRAHAAGAAVREADQLASINQEMARRVARWLATKGLAP